MPASAVLDDEEKGDLELRFWRGSSAQKEPARHDWPAQRRAALFLAFVILLFSNSAISCPTYSIPPTPTRFINDYAGLLAPEAADALDKKLQTFESPSHGQLIVVIFPALPSGAKLEDYTLQCANSWGIGYKDRNNGVVLFVFVQDRMTRLEVGLGLAKVLTNPTCKKIIDNEVKPAFRGGRYSDGIDAAIKTIMNLIVGGTPAPSHT